MNASEVPNQQMRAHLPAPWITKLTYAWHRWHGVQLERSTVLYPSAQLLRYPGNIRLGADVVVKSGAHICPCHPQATISIGERSTIGFHTFLYASERITIGSDCMIAPFVYIVDSNHGTSLHARMNRQPNTTAPVSIGSDVWIGAHAVILAGTSIGDGAVIAAGSVVSGIVEPETIVGGVPARNLAKRK